MATTLNVSGLTDYVNVHKDELFVKATAGARSLEHVEIMPNVKYKDTLNYLDSEVVLADGSVCGFNPQGADNFTERSIETKAVKVEKSWCYKDFEKKVQGLEIKWQAGRETLPAEQKLAESNMARIQDAVERLVWRGDSTLGIDGWLAQATGETLTVKVTVASGSTTTAAIDQVVAAIPSAALAKGVNIFVSLTDFRKYVAEQNAGCCQNKPVLDAASDSIKYFGDSRITIIPVSGLEKANSGETGYIVAATEDALVYGTDLESADNVYRLWFDEKDEAFNMRVLFKAGVQIKFPDEVVIATLQ